MLYNGATGYQSDSATGLQLLGHRYYDPSIGRFLSSDPAKDGTNWYAYCDNNLLIGCDPTGLWSFYRWFYTGNGNASDPIYHAALNQAGRTLLCWTKHFLTDNTIAVPIGATVLGPFPKTLIPKANFRIPRPKGSSNWTSGTRVISQKYPKLRPIARFVKKHQLELWIIYEAQVAWTATYQTLHDQDSWNPD